MALYSYHGRDQQGNAISGQIEKSSDIDVAIYLSSKNITPVDIFLSKNIAVYKDTSDIFSPRIKEEELILFSRQMHTIYRSGLPINKGLEGLYNSLSSSALKQVIKDLITKLKEGLSLSQAMRYHPKVFSDFFSGMVEIGENTGQLTDTFNQIGNYIERDLSIKKSIQSAIRYPLFVLVSIIVALVVINLWVVPAFSHLFERLDADMPLATQWLLWLSNSIRYYFWLIILIFLGVLASLYYFRTTEKGRKIVDKNYYAIPFVGHILYKSGLAHYAFALSTLLKSGVSLNHAIRLSAGVINNRYLKGEILMIQESIRRGDSLYSAHQRRQIFSPLMLQMVHLGEETGALDTLLADIAESYEREIAFDIKRISASIEPLLVIILATFVGILALGIFLPMWSLFETSL